MKVRKENRSFNDLALDELDQVAGGMVLALVAAHGPAMSQLPATAYGHAVPGFGPNVAAGPLGHAPIFGQSSLDLLQHQTLAPQVQTLAPAPVAATGPVYGYFDQNHVFHQMAAPTAPIAQPAAQNPFAQASQLFGALKGFMPQAQSRQQPQQQQQQQQPQQQQQQQQQEQQQQQQQQQQEQRDENGFTAQERRENAEQDAAQDREEAGGYQEAGFSDDSFA